MQLWSGLMRFMLCFVQCRDALHCVLACSYTCSLLKLLGCCEMELARMQTPSDVLNNRRNGGQ
eukprot:6456899-Amphidinium_carterae.1